MGIDPGLVFRAFLITAVTFGATSLAGYVTKRDLSGFGAFFMMAAIGIIIAMLVNVFFFQSTMMSLITSCVTVLLFAGVTAYETQMIKEMYVEGDAGNARDGLWMRLAPEDRAAITAPYVAGAEGLSARYALVVAA